MSQRVTNALSVLARTAPPKLMRDFGGKHQKAFSADLLALEELITIDRQDNWMSGRALQIVRARYKNPKRADRYLARLEAALLIQFGGKCDLDFDNPYHRYPDHAVTCFGVARSQRALRHVTDDQILSAIRPKAHFNLENPPRYRGEAVLSWLRYGHGLFCDECEKVVKDRPEDCTGDWTSPSNVHFWWSQLGICEQCANKRVAARLSRQQKQILSERKFKAAVAEKRRIQNERREQADAAFAAKREAHRAARERGKIERAAAYEFVKDLGLLDQAKKTMEESNGQA